MAINKALKIDRVPVMWNGQEAATVRGLRPSDIAEIFRLAGDRVNEILVVVEEFEFIKHGGGDPQLRAEKILEALPGAIAKVAACVPEFVAQVIAFAADEPESVDHVRDEWNISLQAEALKAVAAATFVDDAGFKAFVGNAMALLQSGNALTSSAKPQSRTGRGKQRSAIG